MPWTNGTLLVLAPGVSVEHESEVRLGSGQIDAVWRRREDCVACGVRWSNFRIRASGRALGFGGLTWHTTQVGPGRGGIGVVQWEWQLTSHRVSESNVEGITSLWTIRTLYLTP